MKKALLVFVFLISTATLKAQEIAWMSMDKALVAQQQMPKKIFMDVYTTWCGPCKLLDKNTFSNPDVIAYINKHFYPVKFNAEGKDPITYKGFTYTNPNYRAGKPGRNATHFFADALKLQGYPSLTFFESDGTLIQSIVGYYTPQELEVFLKMIVTDIYKEITTRAQWEIYQKNFKGTFKSN